MVIKYSDAQDLDVMVEEELLFRYPNGDTKRGRLVVRRPQFSEGDDESGECWFCSSGVDGLFEPVPIFGVSSFQALILSLEVLKTWLNSFSSKGGEILFPSGEAGWSAWLDSPTHK